MRDSHQALPCTPSDSVSLGAAFCRTPAPLTAAAVAAIAAAKLAKQKGAEEGAAASGNSMMGMSSSQAMSGIGGMESSALSSNLQGSVTGSLGQFGAGSSHGASSGARTSQVSTHERDSHHRAMLLITDALPGR